MVPFSTFDGVWGVLGCGYDPDEFYRHHKRIKRKIDSFLGRLENYNCRRFANRPNANVELSVAD